MYSKYLRLMCALSILLMASMACNLGNTAATSTPIPTTVVGEDVPTATETVPPTETATLEPTLEPTETPNLEPSATPTVGVPVAEVVKDVNCRAGPSGAYNLVVALKTGDTVDVVARDLGAGFVFVQVPDQPEQRCWVQQSSLTITGDVTPLPAFTPPPSPTLAPNFTVKYKNTDTCRGDVYVRFIITNTGSSNFRSAYLRVTNLRSGEVAEHSLNAFDLMTGCIIAQNIAPLTVGATGYLQSPEFKKSPKGQKMRAVFQLCTEQFLKGSCATQTLEFTAK